MCRRKFARAIWLKSDEMMHTEHGCDAYEMPAIICEDRKSELALPVQAIDDLKS